MPAHRADPAEPDAVSPDTSFSKEPTSRRRFLGYLLAAPTLVAAAELGGGTGFGAPAANAAETGAGVPPSPQLADSYDLTDALVHAARPTANLITITLDENGHAHFELHRTEVGQGINTTVAMLIAEEMDLPLDHVHVTLADARPELMTNQLTGGSSSVSSIYYPVRTAAAIAKGKLLEAASLVLGEQANFLSSKLGVITSRAGRSVSYGDLATKAASDSTKQVEANLKAESDFAIVGKPTRRIDALDAVTGRKQFTTDLDVPGAKPTMVCRPPTINGTPQSVTNAEQVRRMPGITDVVTISSGVAVRGETYGQCIDAVNALDVKWSPGPVDGESDATVEQKLKDATPPAVIPPTPATKTLERQFTFAFVNGSALGVNAAIADVKPDSAEIWSTLKIPIAAQQNIAQALGMATNQVTVHVVSGGGSFGRALFHDAALEAAEISQKIGKPVRLMWHRADDCRQGRVHPMSVGTIRASFNGDVVSFEQHLASVRTDFSHGLGDAVSSTVARELPGVSYTVSEAIFALTTPSLYNFGITKTLLTETHQSPENNRPRGGFNTGSTRNVYSPDVVTTRELFVDELAEKMGMDPYDFRRKYVKNESLLKVLDKAAEVGGYGKSTPDGVGHGIALHHEYKQTMACFVELDCRPETVNRKVRDGVTGPRVTRGVLVTIPGHIVINPLGLEAMMQGGFIDGFAQALTASVHLNNGRIAEASWDNFFYCRQWNLPFEFTPVVLPAEESEIPAGAGEMGVAPSFAATACAYRAATGKTPTHFPINHNDPLPFEPYPHEPPLPPSPTNGLDYAY
ncbi:MULTISPECIES: molybdopterin cofactor-binding domain-containing protein [Prauserella salsuginis group]|uniref:Molybdopterin cofactor-binding domain-containing protein n=1 Tax=Prauserella salsuginis TaxID=387889 RepID=A0ABW6G7D8_9PSEU|nr:MULTISPECIES: molybdopterin cofactor-binding domain-containing protein [Prauserella salsuginis group]MCR3720713.1 isoquinoline 1-oxidoreductase, beta subunit [Prauserella flava]MCR3735206.1 isoquinoline 1-oxidoreductase, beta subunit [Prauserella salsuginis]